jgi:hypothetical protein
MIRGRLEEARRLFEGKPLEGLLVDGDHDCKGFAAISSGTGL